MRKPGECVAFPRNSISYLPRHPRLKGHSMQTGHPLYAEDVRMSVDDKQYASNVRKYTRTHPRIYAHATTAATTSATTAKQQIQTAFAQSIRVGAHAHLRIYLYARLSIRSRGCAHNSRASRRMLSFRFYVFFACPPSPIRFGKFNADGLRDLSVSRSCETNGGAGAARLFVYDKQKYRPPGPPAIT